MALDPPIDNRFTLPAIDGDYETVRRWAAQLPGIGKWTLFSTLGYTSPFADYSATDRPMRIRREFADLVRIEGVIKSTSNVNTASVAIALPPQFRPVRDQDSPLLGANDGATNNWLTWRVNTAGQLLLVLNNFGAAKTLSFAFVSFTYTLSADK